MISIRKYYIDVSDAGGGGGGGNPTAPKGYVPTTVDQRNQWNAFLDYAGKQNADLSDPKAQAAMMAQYKKANPTFSVSQAQIPAIQYEAYQLRKGDQFGKLGAKELGYIRQGLSPNYINADTNNIGKLYYPQMAKYGTDIEGYYNSKFNPSAAAPAANPSAEPAGPVLTAIPAVNPSEKSAPVPADRSGTIPLPDYNDPKSRAAYLAQFPAKYGSFVHGRGDYIVRINEVPTYGTVSNKEAALNEAKKQGLDPALLYSSTMEEGASGLYPDKEGNINSGEVTDDKYPVSGFGNYGLDNFHGDFKEMVKKGYLPKDFDYKPATAVNENKDKVPSADFKSTEDAMTAKAAYVHLYQDRLNDYLKQSGIDLSDRAKQFFTLIGFNGGPGTAKKLIRYYQAQGLLKNDEFLKHPPDKKTDPGGAFGHVLPRLQMADLLKKEKLI